MKRHPIKWCAFHHTHHLLRHLLRPPLRTHRMKDSESHKHPMPGGLFVDQPPHGGNLWPRVACDACRKLIRGTRYKCVMCPDFDLCFQCHRTGAKAAHHQDERPRHVFVAMEDPDDDVAHEYVMHLCTMSEFILWKIISKPPSTIATMDGPTTTTWPVPRCGTAEQRLRRRCVCHDKEVPAICGRPGCENTFSLVVDSALDEARRWCPLHKAQARIIICGAPIRLCPICVEDGWSVCSPYGPPLWTYRGKEVVGLNQ